MHISSCAKHMQNLKNGISCKRTELTKYTLVDVLVDRHSDRRSNRPILIVSFYCNVERQPCQPGPEKQSNNLGSLTSCLLLLTMKTQMKCRSIRISPESTLFVKVKKNLRTKMQYYFETYNKAPLDMYNGLSQVECIKLEGRIH